MADLEQGNDRFDGSLSRQSLVVLGGAGRDHIQTGDAQGTGDIVFGDRGVLVGLDSSTFPPLPSPQQLQLGGRGGHGDRFANWPLTCGFRASSLREHDGDDDVISTQAGADAVLGGEGGDAVSGGSGLDLLLGDHGFVQFGDSVLRVPAFAVESAASLAGLVGGDDTIDGQDDGALVIGGAGNDYILSRAGANPVAAIGDEGRLAFDDGVQFSFATSHEADATAGDDRLMLEAPRAVAVGGSGRDTVYLSGKQGLGCGDNCAGLLQHDAFM